MKATSANPELWTQRYETLRRYVLSEHQSLGADPFGLVLVARQGVAAWMGCWREAASGFETPSPLVPVTPIRFSSPDWQQQLTQLLAQMTSTHLPACHTP